MQKALLELVSGWVALALNGAVLTAGPAVEITQKQPLNIPAIVMFAFLSV